MWKLTSQELIAELEMEEFGCQGDAGVFGCESTSDPTFGEPPRSVPPCAKQKEKQNKKQKHTNMHSNEHVLQPSNFAW